MSPTGWQLEQIIFHFPRHRVASLRSRMQLNRGDQLSFFAAQGKKSITKFENKVCGNIHASRKMYRGTVHVPGTIPIVVRFYFLCTQT